MRIPSITILAAGLLLAIPLAAQTEVNARVDARADGLVTISNIAGSVAVTAWDRDEVEVTGTLGRGVEELEFDNRGRVTEIEVEHYSGRHRGNGKAHLEIRVPRGSALEIEVISASITVEGVVGELTLESVSGSIEVDGASGNLEIESISGAIDVRGDLKRISVETVSGRVRLEGTIEVIEVETVSGRLEIESEGVRRAELSTTSGSVNFAASLGERADIQIETMSGGVELDLPASTSARFDVSTYSGSIHNELGPPAEKTGRYTPGKELKFTLGGGDGRVRVENFSGSISLRRR